MNRYQASFLYILLTIGIFINVISLIYFKFKISNYYDDSLKSLYQSQNKQFDSFARDTLSLIDSYVLTNRLNTSNSTSVNSVTSDNRPFYEVVDRISYAYFIDCGRAFVDFKGDYLTIGDNFPRGGVITALSRDCLQVDGRYIFININRDSTFSDLYSTNLTRKAYAYDTRVVY